MLAFDLAIHRGQIEAKLPQMFGLEFSALEFDHHIASQLEVIEQQVNEKLVATYVQQHLPTDKGKAGAQLQQKLGHVLDQSIFDLTLLRLIGQPEKIETIRVFQRLPGKIGMWLWQTRIKIAHRLTAPPARIGFDLHDQNIARPVVLSGFG